jgi:hypothetical protein
VPYLEALVGQYPSYAISRGGFGAAALLAGALIVGFGPEAHGIAFRKGGEQSSAADRKSDATLGV